MAVGVASQATPVPAGAEGGITTARQRRARRLSIGGVMPYLLISPAMLYIVALVGYPFLLGIYFSLSNAAVEEPIARFVGLQNFVAAARDSIFRRSLLDSFIFTAGSLIGKAILGTTLAFLLLRPFPGRKVIRGLLVIPWTMPIALSILGWRWMFDPQFSVINWTLAHLGLIHRPYPNWLGDPAYAFAAVLIVNIWRGFPFSAIIVLAGLTSVPVEIIEAAKVDGANWFHRWTRVIVPMIAPILYVGLLYDTVFTFTDLSVVYLLTNGGPINATDILPTLAYRTGIVGGSLGRGSAIALFMLPVLFLAMVAMLRNLRRREL